MFVFSRPASTFYPSISLFIQRNETSRLLWEDLHTLLSTQIFSLEKNGERGTNRHEGGRTERWTNKQKRGRTSRKVDEQTERWTNQQKGGRINRKLDELTEVGRINRKLDEVTESWTK